MRIRNASDKSYYYYYLGSWVLLISTHTVWIVGIYERVLNVIPCISCDLFYKIEMLCARWFKHKINEIQSLLSSCLASAKNNPSSLLSSLSSSSPATPLSSSRISRNLVFIAAICTIWRFTFLFGVNVFSTLNKSSSSEYKSCDYFTYAYTHTLKKTNCRCDWRS